MAWKILTDHVATPGSKPGTNDNAIGMESPTWPDGATIAGDKLLGSFGGKESSLTPFRMLDDDDGLYYEGVTTDGDSDLDPLDDFGTPNAGCTQIQYKNASGNWETINC